MTWVSIPDDVLAWFREAFAEANRSVSETILNMPNVREPTLDDQFIQSLIPRAAPTLLASGAVVRMDIHNIGGLRRVMSWEVADIGVVVFVIKGGQTIARKLALLQAKRLFPKNNDVDDSDPVGFRYGINALLRGDPSPVSMSLTRRFDFDPECVYGSLTADSDQQKIIEEFAKRFGFEVDYLLYNPPIIPASVTYPVVARQIVSQPPPLGCRVVALDTMHGLLRALEKGKSPTFSDVIQLVPSAGWRVEYWAADLLLQCKAGKVYDSTSDAEVLPIIERRSGPIGAAIAINIELPAD